ncbi:MAG: DUF5615 family PIN-like protein [Planctomycetes bacterium]|nr:DUF5615 family PIN-like protein [Planctomycetota bacterium]
MKLLLDQNISHKLVKELRKFFPGTNHIYLLGLHESFDDEIWHYARNNNFTIVTQDSDFSERSILYGYPPQVIWIRTGNVSTAHIQELIVGQNQEIKLFEKDKKKGCLEIFSL